MTFARPVLLRDLGRLGTHWEPLPLFPTVPPPCPITGLWPRVTQRAPARSPPCCRTDAHLESPGGTGGTVVGPGALALVCFPLLCLPPQGTIPPSPFCEAGALGVGQRATGRGGASARAAGRGRSGVFPKRCQGGTVFQTLVAIGKGARAPPAAAGETEGETQVPGEWGDRWAGGGAGGGSRVARAGRSSSGGFGKPWRGIHSERQQLSFFLKWDFLTGNVNTFFSVLLQFLKYGSDPAGTVLNVCTSANALCSPRPRVWRSPELSASPAPTLLPGPLRGIAVGASRPFRAYPCCPSERLQRVDGGSRVAVCTPACHPPSPPWEWRAVTWTVHTRHVEDVLIRGRGRPNRWPPQALLTYSERHLWWGFRGYWGGAGWPHTPDPHHVPSGLMLSCHPCGPSGTTRRGLGWRSY